MARRKVTMLEAFQRSARESAERAALERRRVIAEREREMRRAEAARAAQELGSRLSQRAGESRVGSLIAGMRAPAEDSARDSAGDSAGDAPNDVAPKAIAADVVPATTEALPKRSGPALPSFDRAHQADLTNIADSPVAGELRAGTEEPAALESCPESLEELGIEPQGSPSQDELPFENASHEDVDHAIASLEDDVFELPMSPRTFAVVSAALVAVVFFLGVSFGRQGGAKGESPVSDRAPGQAGLSLSALDGASPEGISREGAPRSGSAGQAWDERADASGSAVAMRPANPNATPPPVSKEPQALEPDAQLTPEDLIFRDPEKKYSILAITYTRTEAHAQMALETYEFLYDAGFPAIHPVARGGLIHVFVGAAETLAQLEDMKLELSEVRSARSGKAEFRSAFLVNIDPYR